MAKLRKPHGFSMGVAAMPPGTANNLHVYYTAEVFMIHRGERIFRWGANGKHGEIVGHTGDVVSIPTWIFRGLTDTGKGMAGSSPPWAAATPAASSGTYLTSDNMLVDTEQIAARVIPMVAYDDPCGGGLKPTLRDVL